MMAGNMKSPLSAATNEKRNTKSGREAMPDSDFAIPERRMYRIDDAAHARDALSRVEQDGSPEDIARVRAAVAKRYPNIQQASKKQRIADRIFKKP